LPLLASSRFKQELLFAINVAPFHKVNVLAAMPVSRLVERSELKEPKATKQSVRT
jgi:hypothetical protein